MRLKDSGEEGLLEDAEARHIILMATREFSGFLPRRLVAETTGDGTYSYALPSAYSEDFSTIEAIEYPAGEQVPEMLFEWEWALYRDPTSGLLLRFLTYSPSANEKFRVFYTALHIVDDAQSTIPAPLENAFLLLCCAIAAEMLAAKFARSTDSTITADVVAHRDKSDRCLSLAKEWRRQFGELVRAFGTAYANWDVQFAFQQDFLVHKRRWR
jgi:hypothetical protein